jgi:hypothetical protein
VVAVCSAADAWEKYRVPGIAQALAKQRGVHPRLYLDAGQVGELRRNLGTTHSNLWLDFKVLADRAVSQGPPAYRERDNSSGDEQLWQREVGNALPSLALAWLLTRDQRYLESARRWSLASCRYPTWGLGRIDGMDLATGHQLYGLGLVYDWCHADLDEATRRTIREMLVRRSTAMFEAAATGKAWWRQSYLQNHLWVNVCGLAVSGMALADEVPDAPLWVGLAQEKFQLTMAALGSDGASHEGVGYWEYGVEYLLKYMSLARSQLGHDFYGSAWWRNTALYAQYLALPRQAWTRNLSVVDIADCPRGHWYGPDYLLRGLAHEYRDGHAQWLAQQVQEARVAAPGAPWLNLLWYDPRVKPQPPGDLPTLRHFDDMGIVAARSDWSGRESLLVFKCGPYLGHQAVSNFTYDAGGGHVHPDANHLVLFGAGEWLLRDDGYRAKWSGQHNTLLVDGQGQLGEGAQWFQAKQAIKAFPRILRCASTPELDQMSGDAGDAYPASLGLRRYQRHVLFLKPDVLLVCDDIVTDRPRALELRFHPESRALSRSGAASLLHGTQASLRLEPLVGTNGVEFFADDIAIEGRHGEQNVKMFTVRMAKQAAAWRSVLAFSWAGRGQPLPTVSLASPDATGQFRVGQRLVTLDWDTGQARVDSLLKP